MNESKGKIYTTLALLASGIIAIAFIGQVGGCQAIQDTVAKAIGAPTSEDRRVVADQLGDAEDKAEEAAAKVEELEKAIAQVDDAKVEAQQRSEMVRETFAQVATQLSSAQGIAADALMETLSSLHAQFKQAKTDVQSAATIVATYKSKISEHQQALTAANRKITELDATLQGFDEQTASAIANTVGLVKFAGDTANTLGIPGAGAAGDTAGAVLGGLLTTVLGGTAVASATRARSNRRRAEATQAQASKLQQATQAQASKLEQVILMTEKLGLIRNDDAAKEAKAVARKELGPDVMALLHTITAKAKV